MKAIWNNTVIAESDSTIVVESNHYFPPESVKSEFLQVSETTTVCPWKGDAAYDNIVVEGSSAEDAVWHYPEPKDSAEKLGIKGYYAFRNDVKVVD